MITTKADKVKVAGVNLSDCNPNSKCPCNAFVRCRDRRAYGSDVWSDPVKKKQAMGLIAFDGNQGITDKEKLNKLWNDFVGKNQRAKQYNSLNKNTGKKVRYSKFFANLNFAQGKKKNALVLPKMNDPYITKQMKRLTSSMYNTAVFTDFQRSMVVRANLVKNGLTLRSDTYRTRKGEADFDPVDLVPWTKKDNGGMWSVDHIQIRAKGGCNRFCNAAVLMLDDNTKVRNDNGPGCPCIIAVAKKDKKPNTDTFTPETDKPLGNSDYTLYVCVTYHRCKKKKGVPDELPGTCHANKPCNLDDPRKGTQKLEDDVVRPVYKRR